MSSLTLMKRKLQGYRHPPAEPDTVLTGLDMRNTLAFQSAWEEVTFDDCKFGLSDFRGSVWKEAAFFRCDLPACNFAGAMLEGVEFRDCDMDQLAFGGAVLRGVTFHHCRLQYAQFGDATLRAGVAFLNCNLHGADLRFIEAEAPDFRGSNLWGAQVGIGCSFFNGKFDDRQAMLFAAMLARCDPDPERAKALQALAGERQVKMVERLMEEKP